MLLHKVSRIPQTNVGVVSICAGSLPPFPLKCSCTFGTTMLRPTLAAEAFYNLPRRDAPARCHWIVTSGNIFQRCMVIGHILQGPHLHPHQQLHPLPLGQLLHKLPRNPQPIWQFVSVNFGVPKVGCHQAHCKVRCCTPPPPLLEWSCPSSHTFFRAISAPFSTSNDDSQVF